jgi:hypothetical protein
VNVKKPKWLRWGSDSTKSDNLKKVRQRTDQMIKRQQAQKELQDGGPEKEAVKTAIGWGSLPLRMAAISLPLGDPACSGLLTSPATAEWVTRSPHRPRNNFPSPARKIVILHRRQWLSGYLLGWRTLRRLSLSFLGKVFLFSFLGHELSPLMFGLSSKSNDNALRPVPNVARPLDEAANWAVYRIGTFGSGLFTTVAGDTDGLVQGCVWEVCPWAQPDTDERKQSIIAQLSCRLDLRPSDGKKETPPERD